jgi:hypothetical protein
MMVVVLTAVRFFGACEQQVEVELNQQNGIALPGRQAAEPEPFNLALVTRSFGHCGSSLTMDYAREFVERYSRVPRLPRARSQATPASAGVRIL